MKGLLSITLLLVSNVFMTLAWYGHLKFKELGWFRGAGLITIVLLSWGLALFEYIFQVPANRLGFKANGGPFDLVQLKTIQEAITLVIFMVFSVLVFHQKPAWNHVVGFLLIVAAVYVIFRKW